MYKKHMRRYIAALLSAAMLTTLIPQEVFATEAEEQMGTWDSQEIQEAFRRELQEAEEAKQEELSEEAAWELEGAFEDQDAAEDSYIVSEITEDRDKSEKVFRLNTGDRMVCEYDVPVHYLDENGIWQEYDTTLELSTANIEVLGDILSGEETEAEQQEEETGQQEEPSTEEAGNAAEEETGAPSDMEEEETGSGAEETGPDENIDVSQDTDAEEDAAADNISDGESAASDGESSVLQQQSINDQEDAEENITAYTADIKGDEQQPDDQEQPVAETDPSEAELPEEEKTLPEEQQPAGEEELAEEEDEPENDGSIDTAFSGEETQIDASDLFARLADGEERLLQEVAVYKTAGSDLDVQITQEARELQMVSAAKEDTRVSWGFEGSNASSAAVETVSAAAVRTTDGDSTGDEAFLEVPVVSQSLQYPNIYDSVDLQCSVSTTGVKDNLILKDASAQSSFRIIYELEGLIPEQAGEKSVYLKDENGEIQYVLSAPCMTDSEGNVSGGLSLTIAEEGEGFFAADLSVDQEWLGTAAYPVTVDPVMTTGQDWGAVSSAFVSNKYQTKCYGYGGKDYEGSLYVGNTGDYYAKARSFIKLNSLPSLGVGDRIVGAYLSLYQRDVSTEVRVDVHEITEDWEMKSINWTNQPKCKYTISEYVNHKRSDGKTMFRTFDITKLVQGWYNGNPNYGVELKSIGEVSESSCFTWYVSGSYPTNETVRPVFSLVYRNNKGLESYWSYSSIDAGEAGTAYVNNYSGNLVFEQEDLFTTGVNKPLSVSHYYNGYMAGKVYGSNTPGVKPYTGLGWKLSCQKTLFASSKFGLSGTDATNYPYVYTDEDGTDHYFYKKTANGKTTYTDEDGLGLTLTIGSEAASKYTVSDDEGNSMVFNSSGYLKAVKEEGGASNTYTYSSDGKTITKIADGNGKSITLTSDSSGYITGMNDSTSDANLRRKVTYTYDGSHRLTKITGYDGHAASYTYYSSQKNLLQSAADAEGNKLTFTYTSEGRVASVKATTPNGTESSRTTFTYPDMYTTIVQSSGIDGIYGNSDDIKETYSFDTYGRTISVHYTCGGKNLGTESYQYTDGAANSSASNIKQLNRISREHTVGVEVINPLDNHNMEYNKSTWSGGSFNTSEHYYGKRSLALTSTGSGQTSSQTISLTAGKTYTASAYVKTTNITGSGEGASIKVEAGNSVFSSDYLSKTTDTAIDNGWRRMYVSFKMPSGVTKATVRLSLSGVSGQAYFDAVQVEEGNAPGAYNQLENAGLERADSSKTYLPAYWSSSTLSTDGTEDCLTSSAYAGSRAFKITGKPAKNKQIIQNVPIIGAETDTYVVSAWTKATGVPDGPGNRRYALAVKITYEDGSSLYRFVGHYNYAQTGWQYVSAVFTLKDDDDTTSKKVTAIAVCPEYYYMPQTMLVDNLQLVKEDVPTYTYNSDGKLVSVVDNAKTKSTMTYSGGNLTKSVDAKGYAYTYTYNSNHSLKTAVSQTGVKYSYSYAAKDRPTQLLVTSGNSSETDKIRTDATYTSGTCYVASETDADGNTVNYTYVNGIGNLKSSAAVVGGKTVTNTYTYEAGSNLPLSTKQTVTNTDGSTQSKIVTNTYSAYHHLTGIASPTTAYTFTYNNAGELAGTSAGGH